MTPTEAAREALAADQKRLEKSRQQYAERMKLNPTPSQDELNRIKLGEPIFHKKGSGAEPEIEAESEHQTRSLEARPSPSGGYQTRAMSRAERSAERPATAPASSPASASTPKEGGGSGSSSS